MDYSPQLLELALMDVLVNIPSIDPQGFSIACGGTNWGAMLTDTFPNSKYDDYYRFMCTICQYASNYHWLNVSVLFPFLLFFLVVICKKLLGM